MPEAIGPTVAQIAYHSAYGAHTMDIPLRQWTAPSVGDILGSVPRWSDDTLIPVDTMLEDLIDLYKPFFPTTVSFDTIQIFTQATPTSSLVPVAGASLTGFDGTQATPGWTKAVQTTISVRDTNANLAKYVFLDCASFNSYDAIRGLVGQADLAAIIAFVIDDANAFSSRAGFKPALFIGAFRTLNERLRKAYRMT